MNVEELLIKISADISDMQQELQQGQSELQKFQKSSESAGSKVGKALTTAGKAVGTAMKTVATGVVAGATAIVGLAASTEEYRSSQAKLQTAFEAVGSSAEQAKTTYNDLYRVLGDGDVAVEAAGHLAQLTTNEQELSEWTNICQGVYATFGDSLPIESLTEAANETAKTGSLTGALADALNWAGVSEEEFQAKLDACATEQEREALIRETLNGLYDEAAAKYEQNAADILAANEAQAALTESLGQLGAAAAPLQTTFMQIGASLLADVVPGLSQALEGVTGLINGTEGAAEKFQEGLGSAIDSLLTKFTEALPQVLDIGIQLITSLIEGILSKLPEVVTVVMEAIPQIVEAILGLLPQLLDSGVQMITAIIEGLSKMVPDLIKAVVDILPDIIDALVKGIPQLLDAAIEFFMAIVEAIPEFLPDLINALPEIYEKIYTTLLDAIPDLLDAAIELFLAVVEAIPEIIPELVDALPEIITTILDALIDALPDILDAAIELFMAIVDAIPQFLPDLVTMLPEIIITVVGALIEAIPDILAAAIDMFGAIIEAVWDLIKKLPKVLAEVITSIKTNLVEKAKKALDFDWELPKIKLPHFKITGKFSLDPPSIPKITVDWYAKGGVFDMPTLFGYGGRMGGLGENGAEAVVPLEKNTEWMDRIAERLLAGMGGGDRQIVLQVDGKTFAQTSISTINDLTRQTGNLALNIV